MNAGLPGLGLGGLFFILTALLAPAIELRRTVRGDSSAASWARVGRQFVLAITMLTAIDLTLRGALMLVGSHGPEGGGITALSAVPLAITMALVAAVPVGAKGLQLALRARERGVRPSAQTILIARARLRRRATAVASTCVGLLVAAAVQLDPVPARGGEPPDGRVLPTERRPGAVAWPVATAPLDLRRPATGQRARGG
jgi:hypothetical protein